jgi:hypothetical protein
VGVKGDAMQHSVSRLAAAILLTAVAGCTSTGARIGPRPPEAFQIIGPTRGGACGLHLFGIIPLGVNSRTERAYSKALTHGGTGLIDTKVQTQWWLIPYVGILHCAVIEGTEIR